MTAAIQAVPQLGPVAICAALGVSRASLHRLQNPPPQSREPMQRPSPNSPDKSRQDATSADLSRQTMRWRRAMLHAWKGRTNSYGNR